MMGRDKLLGQLIGRLVRPLEAIYLYNRREFVSFEVCFPERHRIGEHVTGVCDNVMGFPISRFLPRLSSSVFVAWNHLN